MPPNLTADWTLEQLHKFLRENNIQPEGYQTANEWREKLGVSKSRMYKLLHLAKKRKALLISRQPREALGYDASILVYAFNIEPEKE